MPLAAKQLGVRIAVTGTVTSGGVPLDVPHRTTVADLFDLFGEAWCRKLLESGRAEFVGTHVPVRLLYAVLPESVR